jgi:peptidoglycan/LPS O-acetylase OafA/YrhL
VQVFFVLSGFLIGGILLDLKKIPELSLGSRLSPVLRAACPAAYFPVYYLTLFALLASSARVSKPSAGHSCSSGTPVT